MTLRRIEGFYGGSAAENGTGTSAKFTFEAPVGAEIGAAVTLFDNDSIHGTFIFPSGRALQISSEGLLRRHLDAQHFDHLQGVDQHRILSAEVIDPRLGGCSEDELLDNLIAEDVKGSSHRREGARKLSTRDNCEVSELVESLSIGIVTDKSLLELYSDDEDAMNRYVENMIATNNVIFRKQLNLVLRVDELIHQPEEFGNFCQYQGNDALTELERFARRPEFQHRVAHYHRISGCNFANGIVGTANFGTVCNSFGGVHTAVTTHGSYGWTYLTFAHEIGHGLGAPHPFTRNSDKGKFGGIMDYGNGKLRGTDHVGFTDATINNICIFMRSIRERRCEHLGVYVPAEPTCGDGVISGDEECECPKIGDTKCGPNSHRCDDCKLKKEEAECSDDFLMILPHGPAFGSKADNDCCKGGKLQDAKTPCNNGEGFCVLGKCVDRCNDFYSQLELCGTLDVFGGCRQSCLHNGICKSYLTTYSSLGLVHVNQVADGAKCRMYDGSGAGVCQDGFCVKDSVQQEIPTPRPTPKQPPKPTPEPTRIEDEISACKHANTREECCKMRVDGVNCVPAVDGKNLNGKICRSENWIAGRNVDPVDIGNCD